MCRYLPLLLDTIDFQATDAGEPILDALDALGRAAGRGQRSPYELPMTASQALAGGLGAGR